MFIENFRRICKEKGTSTTAVLVACGYPSSRLGTFASGSIPKQVVMEKLADYLGCRVMDFFADEATLKAATPLLPENDDEREIMDYYRSLSRQDKHEFMSNLYAFKRTLESRNG